MASPPHNPPRSPNPPRQETPPRQPADPRSSSTEAARRGLTEAEWEALTPAQRAARAGDRPAPMTEAEWNALTPAQQAARNAERPAPAATATRPAPPGPVTSPNIGRGTETNPVTGTGGHGEDAT